MSKVFSRYLRTNYRITGGELDSDAIGAGLVAGSWGGGAGTKKWAGGFIMGSFASEVETSALIRVSAAGAIASYFGSAPGWSDITGFRIFPFAVYNASVTPSVVDIFKFTHSAGTSTFGIVCWRMSTSAADNAFTESCINSATGASVHVVWAGWIVSGPT